MTPTDKMDAVETPLGPDQLFSRVFERVYRYWRRWDEGLWRYLELTAVRRLLRASPELMSGPILDLGCGDGEIFELLFGRRPDAFGVDSGATRPADLDAARASGRYAEVRNDDARRLSFEDARFGLVFANSVLEHITPVAPVLREAARVLRRGGYFLFTTPHPRLYSREVYAWRRLLAPLGLDLIGRHMVARECRAYHHVSILPFEAWARELQAAGFGHVVHDTYAARLAALSITRFGGVSRLPYVGAWLAPVVSREARALSGNLGEAEWIATAWRVLEPLFDISTDGGEGCGQLILARKPL